MSAHNRTFCDPSPGSTLQQSRRRDTVLAQVLDPSRLPTPPAVALQVAQTASRPNCRPSEISALLSQDPTLCAKLLKAVNSCLYGLSRPVAGIERAVTILGLNTVRSLALGLSLPAIRSVGPTDASTREYWIQSVGGAIIARELAIRMRYPCPEDDLVAGLLRDLGTVLLQQTFPNAWEELANRCPPGRRIAEPCEVEEEAFGVCHADISAELLRRWNLPEEIVEPIRYHHRPELVDATHKTVRSRAELLYFAEFLVHLDTVIQHQDVLDRVLLLARERYSLSKDALVALLGGVVPKIVEFGRLLDQDISKYPNFAAILSAGSLELAELTVETQRSRLNEGPPTTEAAESRATVLSGSCGWLEKTPAPPRTPRPIVPPARVVSPNLPEFRPAHVACLPPRGCRLGEYELRAVLGRGAMGVVFKAYEPSLDRDVAIKVLAPQLAALPVAHQRFAREARTAAAIQHEHVIGIHAVREAAGLPYLAMEYVEGGSLHDRLVECRPIPPSFIARVAREVASGLAAAHEKGIVHRDIKPANILVEAKTGHAKITDFGLARGANDSRLSVDGLPIGTPHFMSPEQVEGYGVGPASDLFSLGGVLYNLCTGEMPFQGDNVAAVLRAVCTYDPAPPRKLQPDIVPEWLSETVMRLLRKNPAHRFETAGQLVSWIDRHL